MDARRRPEKSEYNAYYEGYISLVPAGDIVAILRQQLLETTGLLGRLTPAQLDHRYAPGKWSVREVFGHLIDTEWVFASRALHMARGVTAPLPGIDQDEFMATATFAVQPIEALIEQYRGLRTATAAMVDALDDTAWDRVGTASGYPFTVRAFPYIIAGHERHHSSVIRERYLR